MRHRVFAFLLIGIFNAPVALAQAEKVPPDTTRPYPRPLPQPEKSQFRFVMLSNGLILRLATTSNVSVNGRALARYSKVADSGLWIDIEKRTAKIKDNGMVSEYAITPNALMIGAQGGLSVNALRVGDKVSIGSHGLFIDSNGRVARGEFPGDSDTAMPSWKAFGSRIGFTGLDLTVLSLNPLTLRWGDALDETTGEIVEQAPFNPTLNGKPFGTLKMLKPKGKDMPADKPGTTILMTVTEPFKGFTRSTNLTLWDVESELAAGRKFWTQIFPDNNGTSAITTLLLLP